MSVHCSSGYTVVSQWYIMRTLRILLSYKNMLWRTLIPSVEIEFLMWSFLFEKEKKWCERLRLISWQLRSITWWDLSIWGGGIKNTNLVHEHHFFIIVFPVLRKKEQAKKCDTSCESVCVFFFVLGNEIWEQ